MRLTFHPLANLFPLMSGAELKALAADIKAKGQLEKIVLYEDGRILDGRNRYLACRAARVTPRTEPYRGRDPLGFVISKNLPRRHMNDDQRRMVAARIANMGRGRPGDNTAECGIKIPDAAKMVNVDVAGVERARTVIASAAPEVQAAVDSGMLSVNAAAQAVKLDTRTQRKIAKEAEAGHANVVRTVVKKEARKVREKELGKKQLALPDRKYGVIYADPEWQFEPYSRDTGMDRAADNHYPTTPTLEICTRPVGKIAAKDCALFLWATAPMLPAALRVMSNWGFEYKTHQIWNKTRTGKGRGTGYWFTGEHELLLVGTRGSIPAPATALGPSSIDAPWQGRHSAKPACFAEMIERAFPTLPKIELNRRGTVRPGWDAWGNEVESSYGGARAGGQR